MTLAKLLSPAIASGVDENCIGELQKILKYPLKQRDPKGSRFWYLHPGVDESEAKETCPIAVGFYSELNNATDGEIRKFLTDGEPQPEIYRHYTSRTSEDQPVMYLLLPAQGGSGRVPLVLPNEGGLRSRQIQTFDWNEPELLARLSRLQQGALPIAEKAMCSVPLVEWLFYEPIKTAGELARKLAEVARKIEKAIPKVYAAEKKKTDGYLHKLLKSFQQELLPTLQLTSDNEKDYSFADIYAQTIAYGLFTARVFSYVKDEREGKAKETDFNRQDAWKQLPETNPFLRKLFRDVSEQTPQELGDELMEAISEIFSILRAAKMDAILSDFRQKMNREDIVIRFYEDFLAAYKPQMRERRGVYYTPEPVVSYMVRSVDEMLKDKFNKPLGLADPEVMILDPACGTGTFLLWICQLIYQRFQESPEALTEGLADKSWSSYVKERLLPRIFGFELLMAPYAIAHLKLGLFLEETGYQFDSGKRLGVYLTNTLENTDQKEEVFLEEYIAEEADAAEKIKRSKPIVVIVGNPPYSALSANLTEANRSLVEKYKYIDGEKIKEKSYLQLEKNLQEDYVKFISISQERILKTKYGIVALITNNSWIDGPTHRGIRYSLSKSFDSIYQLNLHGSAKKKEKAIDGSKDDNIFDIQQGVGITICQLNADTDQSAMKSESGIYYSELYGSRDTKYNYLRSKTLNTTSWNEVKPILPLYLFIPQNESLREEYNNYFSLVDIMPTYGTGIITARDKFSIDENAENLIKRVSEFATSKLSDSMICTNFGISLKKGWDVGRARRLLKEDLNSSESFVYPLLYRPFDKRKVFYHDSVVWSTVHKVMDNLNDRDNLSLITSRLTKGENYKHVLVSDSATEVILLSSKTSNNAFSFPLYIYSKTEIEVATYGIRRSNFCKCFLNLIEQKIGFLPEAESIFFYMYSILHSPKYRIRYTDFLSSDYPRIPVISDRSIFRQLATYGKELVALHLMKSPKLDNLITQFIEDRGDHLVDAGHPKFRQGEVVINKKGDKFTGVPENVWNFHVGGYQVCQKWLKDRKGRTLSNEDIQHYQRIVVALKETIEIMENIDKAIPSFPIQ